MAPSEATEVPPEGKDLTGSGRLGRAFYARPALDVARDLLGRDLVRTLEDGSRLVARIVETEGYQQDDPASHSFRGLTPRTEVMFGPPGRVYVYFTYGMHFCMNVVTGQAGEGSAVLLRAARPLKGLGTMRGLRGIESERLLCAGPGRLCQALAVGRELNGADLLRGSQITITRGEPVDDQQVVTGPRVGIRSAMGKPWRFFVAGSPYISRGPVRLPGVRG